MKHRQNLTLLSIAILLMLLLVALSGSTRGTGAIVSPLDVQRPTPTSELTPWSNLPAVMYNYSPLPTPTVTSTPAIRPTP